MKQAAESGTVAADMREVTDDEVAFYAEHGWVKLVQLVSPALADELLRAGNAWHERQRADLHGWNPLALTGTEPFHTLVFSEVMGRNAMRLVNRRRLSDAEIPLRYRSDHFVVRPPGDDAIPYHQDSAEHGSDRVGELQFWLALSDVTPEMGAMRFITGSHREGPLGAVFADTADLLAQYDKLTDVYELSPPLHYRAGDATVHHGYTVHGSPPNTTTRPRLSYIYSYTPADTRWVEGSVRNWGTERKPLSDERNPVVYPPPT